ncbi:unnamed protein product, partial [Adineta ricciae]
MKANQKKTAAKSRSAIEIDNDENFDSLTPLPKRKSPVSNENNPVTTTLSNTYKTSMLSDNNIVLTVSNSDNDNSVLQSIANTAMTPSTSNNANLESFTSDNILSAPAADNCRTVPTPITTSSPLLNDKNQTLEPSLDVDVIATSPVNCASMQPSNNN